jgi:hypothetical protein
MTAAAPCEQQVGQCRALETLATLARAAASAAYRYLTALLRSAAYFSLGKPPSNAATGRCGRLPTEGAAWGLGEADEDGS